MILEEFGGPWSLSAGSEQLLRRLLRHCGNRGGSAPGGPGTDRCVRGSAVASGRVRERHVPVRVHPGLRSRTVGYGETRVARRGSGGRGWGVQHGVLVGLRTAPRHEGLRLQPALSDVLRPAGHRVRRLDARRIRNRRARGRADPPVSARDVCHACRVVRRLCSRRRCSFARATGGRSRPRTRTSGHPLRSSASGGHCAARPSTCPRSAPPSGRSMCAWLPLGVFQPGPSTPANFDPTHYLLAHGFSQVASYQPGNWFWPFQWIEAGWLLGLSVLLGASAIWLVRRRAT